MLGLAGEFRVIDEKLLAFYMAIVTLIRNIGEVRVHS